MQNLTLAMRVVLMHSHSHIMIGSNNCREFNNSVKKDYIGRFLNGSDISCPQEHWLCNKQLSELSCTYCIYAAVSGFGDSEVLYCRPYCGCAILWRADINIHSHIVPAYVLHVLSLLCENR